MLAAAIAAAAGLAATPARAHLVETGVGAYYDGLAHVLLTPADLLVVLALALLAGQRGQHAARGVQLALPLSWLAGGAIGSLWPSPGALTLATTLSFAAAGARVALNMALHLAGVVALAVAAGLVHGVVNGATMGAAGAGGLALAGAVTAVFCRSTVVAAEVSRLSAPWTCVAVRVAGSWIAAAGVLMLGWLLRGP